MSTIERAKKYHDRITGYQVMMEPDEGALIRSLYAQARVARALIRQEMKDAHVQAVVSLESWDSGVTQGLKTALDILDAVYGRKK